MKTKPGDVLKDAMTMPAAQRAVLAEKLISSLEPQTEEEVEIAWQEEAARRLAEVSSGRVQTVSWESIRDRLRKSARDSG